MHLIDRLIDWLILTLLSKEICVCILNSIHFIYITPIHDKCNLEALYERIILFQSTSLPIDSYQTLQLTQLIIQLH